MAKKIRTMIVEDQPLFRDLLRGALTPCPSVEVVGAVDNPRDAIRLALENKPEVILMDIDLGADMTGIEAARFIKERRPETGIVILSSHRDKEFVRTVIEGTAGGWSYLLKQSVGDRATLVTAIEGSAWGYVTLDPALISDGAPVTSASGKGVIIIRSAPGSIAGQIAAQTGISPRQIAAMFPQVGAPSVAGS